MYRRHIMYMYIIHVHVLSLNMNAQTIGHKPSNDIYMYMYCTCVRSDIQQDTSLNIGSIPIIDWKLQLSAVAAYKAVCSEILFDPAFIIMVKYGQENLLVNKKNITTDIHVHVIK